MTAPLPALVALRDAVGALTEAFPEQTFDTPGWWTRLKLDTKQLPFTSCQQLIDMWRALQGDLNAAERLRMALLPETRMLIKQQDDGRWGVHIFHNGIGGLHPVESIARTLAVLNALIGKERE